MRMTSRFKKKPRKKRKRTEHLSLGRIALAIGVMCGYIVSAYNMRMPTFNKIAQTTTSDTALSIKYVGHDAFLFVFSAPIIAIKHRAIQMSPMGMRPLDSMMSNTSSPPVRQCHHFIK